MTRIRERISGIAQKEVKTQLKARLLDPIGQFAQAPRIQLSSPLVRGGNFLYYWQWAYHADEPERPARVLHQEIISPWLAEFPLAAHLTIRKTRLNVVFGQWIDRHRHRFGEDFTTAQLEAFCSALISSSEPFQRRLAAHQWNKDVCVVNVRRGDYYQYPHLRDQYGLDIETHIAKALVELQMTGREVKRFVLVSDDLDWCLRRVAPILPGPVIPRPHRFSMFDDLAALAASRTLILANSTFSFWGSHLATSLNPEHLAVAPPYHYRNSAGEFVKDAFDPRWIVTGDGAIAGD